VPSRLELALVAQSPLANQAAATIPEAISKSHSFVKLLVEINPWPRPARREPEGPGMCRNIKTLFNFDPPVTPEEVRAASLQFVRKISGFNKPSQANEAAFFAAIDEIASSSMQLLQSLATNAPPKNREEEAAKARARGAVRFGA
jgi:hypothetical protein